MIDDIKIAEAVAFHLKQVQIGAYDQKDDAAAEALQGILRLFGDDASALIDDAKRYRWLRNNADRDDEEPHISVEFEDADNEDGEDEYFTSLKHRWLTGERADKAIDAAMNPAKRGEK